MTHFLQKHLGLERIILAPSEEDWNGDLVSTAIAATAASWMPRLLKNAKVIGLGWGATMYRTSAVLPHRTLGGEPIFIPMIGATGVDKPSLQINTIIDRFSGQLQGDGFFANLPAFREKNVPLTTFETKRLRQLREYWEAMDAAVFGLGGWQSSIHFFDEEVSASALERISKAGVIGDILSQFFFEDGTLLEQDDSYQMNAFLIENLKPLARTICLAGGPAKTEPILTAARAGFFKILITDTQTAKALYERIRREIES